MGSRLRGVSFSRTPVTDPTCQYNGITSKSKALLRAVALAKPIQE